MEELLNDQQNTTQRLTTTTPRTTTYTGRTTPRSTKYWTTQRLTTTTPRTTTYSGRTTQRATTYYRRTTPRTTTYYGTSPRPTTEGRKYYPVSIEDFVRLIYDTGFSVYRTIFGNNPCDEDIENPTSNLLISLL